MIEIINIRRGRLNHRGIADDLILDRDLDIEADQDLEIVKEILVVEEKIIVSEGDLGVAVTMAIIMLQEDTDEGAGVEVGAGVLMVVGHHSDERGAPGVAIDMDLIHRILVVDMNLAIATVMNPTDLHRLFHRNADVAMMHLLVCHFLYGTFPVISVFRILEQRLLALVS